MVEKSVAVDILEGIEADLRRGNTDKTVENIDRILNNKLYNLLLEYRKMQEKYGKDSKKAKKIEQKIDKEMNNVLYLKD